MGGMTDSSRPPAPGWRRIFQSRPHITQSVVIGAVVWTVLASVPMHLRWSTLSILAWDLAAAWFLGSMLLQNLPRRTAADIRATAAKQDEGRGLTLALVLIPSLVSLASVAAELGLAKGEHGWVRLARVSLAGASVALSWFMVQLIFALHYAHGFYAAPRESAPDGGLQVGGLRFPGTDEPDYWDFIHFAVVIGAAAQTADIAFDSRAMRRIGTVHTLVAFGFNTIVLALSINLLASLI